MLTHIDRLLRRRTAESVLREAGQHALERFRSHAFTVQEKGMQDFVSEVDRETEAFIRARLAESFPSDGFFGEEHGGAPTAATWVVDPIDGTTNFVRNIPFWCLSAGFVVNGQPEIGVVYDPNLDEMFAAHRGGGCWLNGTPISVSDTDTPETAVLAFGFSFRAPADRNPRIVSHLLSAGAVYRMQGAGALSMAHCAAGRVDGFFEAHMMPWDAAAGLALIVEAGGLVSSFGDNDGFRTGNVVLASTPPMAGFFSAATGVALPH
ncbi:inositol monophosphatase family protein [Tropicimonas marinistellae]|uniref:inositol monophosphatase family protein n=1 Tax=Tropicimonas marinistellae TaxID=1739787 RepID=UPI00083478BB|nr:inositol monophosphatase family protein [Tropicimonas marinistellae]